jgi:hypothetical protein
MEIFPSQVLRIMIFHDRYGLCRNVYIDIHYQLRTGSDRPYGAYVL